MVESAQQLASGGQLVSSTCSEFAPGSHEAERKLRGIDLFCGIGGSSWGARAAGVSIVAGFDRWGLAGQVYEDNFPEAEVYSSSLQDVDLEEVTPKLGHIDLILASPECTSHSVARGGKERDTKSMDAAFEVLRFARALKARWIIIENVPHMKNWDRYDEFLEDLKKDYKVTEQSLTASDFGVPQRRTRLFLLCDRCRTPSPVAVPDGVALAPASRVLNLNGNYTFTSVNTKREATQARAKRAIAAVGNDKPFIMVYYGTDGAGGWQKLDVPLRTVTTLDRFALVKPGKNGGGHEMRMLQPPELQAAMGFPAVFKLQRGTRREKIHLLGNAVCPPVMQFIVESLTSGAAEPEVSSGIPSATEIAEK